MVKNWTALQWF